MSRLSELTQEEYFAHIEDHGHVLRRNADGSVDDEAVEFEHHSGPSCVRVGCYESWCVYCRPVPRRCIGATPELFPLTPEDAKR